MKVSPITLVLRQTGPKLGDGTYCSGSLLLPVLSCFNNRESYMSAHVLLNLLNKFGENDKMQGFAEHHRFSQTNLINSMIQEHKCKILFII